MVGLLCLYEKEPMLGLGLLIVAQQKFEQLQHVSQPLIVTVNPNSHNHLSKVPDTAHQYQNKFENNLRHDCPVHNLLHLRTVVVRSHLHHIIRALLWEV